MKQLINTVKKKAFGLWLWASALLAIRKGTRTANQTSEESSDYRNLYQSLNDLPFEVFKKCCVKQEYHLLQLDPTEIVPHEALERAWVNLYSEFLIVSEDEQAPAYLSDRGQFDALESRIFRVKTWCNILLENYSEWAAQKLKDMGYMGEFSPTTYIKDIERTIKKLRNLEVQRDQLQKHFTDQITDKETGSSDAPFAVFAQNLLNMARVFKIYVEPKTALDYAVMLKDYRAYSRKNEPEEQNQEA